MLLNVVGVGLVGTIAASLLDCGEIVFLDGSNQPVMQPFSHLLFLTDADVRDDVFDGAFDCFGWDEFGTGNASIGAAVNVGTPEIYIGKQREFQFTTLQVSTLKPRAVEVRALKLRGAKICAGKPRTAEVCRLKPRIAKVRGPKPRTAEVRGPKLREVEVRAIKYRGMEVRAIKVREAELRFLKRRAAQVRAFKVRGAAEDRLLVLAGDPRQRPGAEVRALKLRVAEICPLKLRVAEICPLKL